MTREDVVHGAITSQSGAIPAELSIWVGRKGSTSKLYYVSYELK